MSKSAADGAESRQLASRGDDRRARPLTRHRRRRHQPRVCIVSARLSTKNCTKIGYTFFFLDDEATSCERELLGGEAHSKPRRSTLDAHRVYFSGLKSFVFCLDMLADRMRTLASGRRVSGRRMSGERQREDANEQRLLTNYIRRS